MQLLEPGPLGDCTAIVVAHQETTSASLLSLSQRVGFGHIATISNQSDQPLRPLVFFMVHYDLGTEAKQKLIKQIRAAASPGVRLAPIILFVPDGPYDQLLAFIEMGFDDVICLPEKRHILAARLAKQVDQEHIYIETANYLGPDRRRMERGGQTHPSRQAGGFEHRKLTVLRTVELGPQVIRTHLSLKANQDAGKYIPNGRRAS